MNAGPVDWLRAQRWFRAKQRPIQAFAPVDEAPLASGRLMVLEVTYADGGPPERYLAPQIDGREPMDGEGAWAGLVRAIADEAELPAEHGRFVCRRTDALHELLPDDLAERRLRVEQSNTSVVVGERLILKLYRLLERGVNPDVEVSAFLTDAGFADTPALAGWVTYEAADAPAAAAAMLQEYVPGAGDAWRAMLDTIASEAGRAVELAARIGDLTTRMHAALASRPDDPGFPWRTATVAQTGEWRTSAERELALAIDAVSGVEHERLVAVAPVVRARFADAFGSATGATRIGRIHGDYHLGQLLARADGGFSVIDFEGEPARSLEERSRPASPLRDVAGMLRSLDYAARTVERESGPAAGSVLPAMRASFLGAYGALTSGDAALLDAFELEKACYEVRYEAGNRPDWLWLPLDALERLAAIIGPPP